MRYDKGTGEFKNWILAENGYGETTPAKFESVMCQGNGYMCVRAATEELPAEKRYTLVAGTFNRLPEDHCNELANSPDFTEMKIFINGEKVGADGIIKDTYERYINFKNGLLERSYTWKSSKGMKFNLKFRRVVSLANKHLAAFRVEITSLRCGADIRIITGIDGETIPKAEHMSAISANAENGVLTVATKTCQSDILFYTAASVDVDRTAEFVHTAKGKKATVEYSFRLNAKETAAIDKRALVYTNRDRERDGCSLYCLEDTCERELSVARNRPFECILAESAEKWADFWADRDIEIDGTDTDQLAARFALYHLTCMSPVHDNRMNIGAKGLSGPGYYGHAFWDTEIYMLPYFIFAAPEEARSLVEYRVNCLDAAREYAKKAGCAGARYPWEAAWITDGEATPDWCDTGDLELHITADVAFGAYYYYVVSGDEDFMEKGGYELIFECAKFWASRLEYNRKTRLYEITDVIGPNEYKSHVNNNAYTNHMVHNCIAVAMEYCEKLKAENPDLYERLNKKIGLKKAYGEWENKVGKIYLPRENEDGIIPEDDTFLTLPRVDDGVHSISEDPAARERAGKIGYPYCMISKQADVVALLYLLEDLFTPECKKKNFYFYERCCLHDSSLSLSTFSALAADLHEREMAYKLFSRAAMIDMDSFSNSDAGVHAASLGGIWQCCVLGFGGVRRYGNALRIQPNLPDQWKNVKFRIWWQGQQLEITEDHDVLSVKNLTGDADVQFLCNGKVCSVGDGITVNYKEV